MNKHVCTPENTIIAFDLHEVIVRPEYKNLFSYCLRNLPRTWLPIYGLWPLFWVDLIKARLKSKVPEVNFEMMCQRYRKLENVRKHFIALSNMQQFRPEIIKLIKELKEKNYSVYLFSNIGPKTLSDLRSKLPLDELLDGYFSPTQEHNFLHKPHQQFYELFKNFIKAHHGERQIIFIDDKTANIKAAQKTGMVGIKFKNPRQLKQALKLHGI